MSKHNGERLPPPFYLSQPISEVAWVAKQTGREIKSLDLETQDNAYCVEVENKTDVALAIGGLGIGDETILAAKLHYPDCVLTVRYVPDLEGENIDWRVTEVEE